jgi:general secretion pathway protein B
LSFILEALRKSEHERQRQAGPAVAEMPVVRPPSRTPVALIAIGLLLAINLAVLLYFLLRNDAPDVVREEPVAVRPAPAAEDAGRPAPVVRAVQPPPAPVVDAPPSREVRPLADVAAPEPLSVPMRDAPEAPDPMLLPPAPAQQVTYAEPPPPAPGSSGPPRLDTLPAQATAGLPALNLDLHIYASDPTQRAAFINGRRYREGDSLPEGVEVRAITPEGVVLQYRGQRFLLPRQ